jgi:hypothetical protein
MNYPGRLIKKGENDIEIVRAIQVKLNEKGLEIIPITGIFNEQTKRVVKLFQARNFDKFGNPLIVDGVLGAITWESLFRVAIISTTPLSIFNSNVLEIASSQIGVMENPLFSNSGTEVDAYLASVNLGPSNAWCMAFVYYCFNQASSITSIANPLVKTGGCLKQWNESNLPKITTQQATNDPAKIKIGSVFIMDFGGGLGHTGIVENISNGFITAIEGNTNNDHSRNGVGVFRNIRKINTINRGFIII